MTKLAWKPCSTFWNSMTLPRRLSRMMVNVSHRTSTRTIPQNYLPPFGRSTTNFQVIFSANQLLWNAFWTNSATFFYRVSPGHSYYRASAIHHFRCSTLIPEGPLYRFDWSLLTSHLVCSSSVTSYPMVNCSTATVMLSTRGGGILVQINPFRRYLLHGDPKKAVMVLSQLFSKIANLVSSTEAGRKFSTGTGTEVTSNTPTLLYSSFLLVSCIFCSCGFSVVILAPISATDKF